MKRISTPKITILFFLFASFLSYGQGVSCDLNTLEKEYNIGRFETVDKRLRSCLPEFKKDESKYLDGLRLLTMNSIMLDDMNQAVIDVNTLLDFNSKYIIRSNDPYIFKELIKKYRTFEALTVTSVSKFEETLDEAPASIYVVTAKEIENRGYLDIEQVFHDLPGFSVSKSNGPAYSLIYSRGYRSTLNDKFLLLIDGIEENDLNSDNAIINRQIPLSNIKQIEVIYGPSSTMYGANAFSAVINIITKESVFKDDNSISTNVQINTGTWNTSFIDATVAKKLKNGYVSITGRLFQSDEMDLTNKGYDYNPASYNYLSEAKNLSGNDALEFINNNGTNSPLFNFDANTQNPTVSLNQAGADKMKTLDQQLFDENENLGFNNTEKDWYFNVKLKVDNFTFGIESFKSNTGALPWYTKSRRIASEDLSRWISWNSAMSIKYEKKINQNLFFTNLASYRLHTLDGNTNLATAFLYNNNNLDFQNLFDETSPYLDVTYFYRSSNQIRNELKLFYRKNSFNIVTGLELRQGIFQMNSLAGDIANPNENIDPLTPVGIQGGNISNKLDAGFYAQGKYAFSKSFSATFGGRLDYNLVRSNGGYGFVFNPRLAVVYSKKDKYTFKAIYSEAFKDASFLTKYATTDTRIANPSLQPEKVKNYEITAILKPIKNLSIEVNAFMAQYSNVVSVVSLGNGFVQNQASELGNNITGLQSNVKYTFNNLDIWANFTYLNPIDESVDKRVSDIPSNSINAGINYLLFKKLNTNIRVNYVGERKTGLNTSGSSSSLNTVDAYTTLHANINYELFSGFKIGILANNILDQEYFHPGVRSAANRTNNELSIQNRRSIMFRANFKF